MADNRVQIIIDALNLAKDDLQRLQKDLKGVGPAAQEGSKGLDLLKKVAATVGLAKLGQEALQFSKESIMLSARVETLGIVTETLGKNAGYTADEIRALEQSVADQGITMQKSRESLALMMQSQIDLAYATDLARMAQDTAVISNKNSSEAFRDLVHIVQTGSVLMARNAGIAVSFTDAYDDWAEANGRTTDSLTEQERVMIRLNTVLAAGVTVQGTYDAAMETAGKKASSYARHLEGLQVAFGDLFQGEYIWAIDVTTELTDNLTNLINISKDLAGVEEDLEKALRDGLISVEEYAVGIEKVNNAAAKLKGGLMAILYLPLAKPALVLKGLFETVTKFTDLSPSDLGVIGKILGIDDLQEIEAAGEAILENERAIQLLMDATDDYANLAQYMTAANVDSQAEFDALAERLGITTEELGGLLGMIDETDAGLEELGQTAHITGKDLEEAGEQTKSFLDKLDRSIESPMEAFIDDLEWFIATGGKFDAAFAAVQEAVETHKITPEQGIAFTEQLLTGVYDVKEEMELMNWWDASVGLRDATTMSLDEAINKITGTNSMESALGVVGEVARGLVESGGGLNEMDMTLSNMNDDLIKLAHGIWDIDVALHIVSSYAGTTGGGNYTGDMYEGVTVITDPGFTPPAGYASGTNFIIPPGFPNDTFPIGYGTSGEEVSVKTVAQQQQPSGGNTYNIYPQSEGASMMLMDLIEENQLNEAML